MATTDNLSAGRRPIKIGLVGAGRAALDCHVPALKELERLFSLVAICDVLKERRDSLAIEYPQAQLYRQATDLFDDPEIDLVIIATPTTFHESQIREALGRGKWTVCEAPIALSHEGAMLLAAASQKARGRLITYLPGLFSPGFHLATRFRHDKRLGEIHSILVRSSDYIRRDDWQSVRRCGGGAAWYAAPDALCQLLRLMEIPPSNLWCDMKRVASVGDAEDYFHLHFKTRESITGTVDISGGRIPPFPPDIEIVGSRGCFHAWSDSPKGVLHVIDPERTFQRRRSSVRTPGFGNRREQFEMIDIPVSLDDDLLLGGKAFWTAVYKTVRTAADLPVRIEDATESIRFIQLAKKSAGASI